MTYLRLNLPLLLHLRAEVPNRDFERLKTGDVCLQLFHFLFPLSCIRVKLRYLGLEFGDLALVLNLGFIPTLQPGSFLVVG